MKWKMMFLFVCLFTLFATGMLFAEEPPKWDVVGDVRMIIPRKDESYSHTFGGEIMGRYWFDNVGIGLSAGSESWRLNDDKAYIGANTLKIDGRTQAFPVGIHGLWRFDSGHPFDTINFLTGRTTGTQSSYAKAHWTVSAGICYLAINDSAQLEVTGPGGRMEFPLKTDETWVARIQVAYEDDLPILNIPIIAGLGYQRDISRGDVKVSGVPNATATNDMSGGYLRLGFPIPF